MNGLASVTVSIFRKVYILLFARPSMQKANRIVFHCALHAFGYNNYGDLRASGEDAFIKILARHAPGLCIDVGANTGEYSRELLERTAAKVIAFEPLPGAFAELTKLRHKFPGRFFPINEGVGDRETELPLHFGADNSPLASFSTEIEGVDYVGTQNRNSVIARVDTLDSFFRRNLELGEIDLLKIDTEGFEYEVLAGAMETIATRSPKFVQVEYNWHQLFRRRSLRDIAALLPGYGPYQILPNGNGLVRRDTSMPETNIYSYANFVFVRSDISI